VQHGESAEQRDEGGDEHPQVPSGLRVDRVDRPGGDRQTEQVGHRLGDAAVRYVLAAEEVGDEGTSTRPVADRGTHVVWERGSGLVAARTGVGVRPVLGDGRVHFGDIDHLPRRETLVVGETERVPAVPAALRTVLDDLVGVGGNRKTRTGCPALLATLALCSGRRAPIALFRLTLAFCRRVTRGRPARVAGVLAELPLQLRVLRPQLFDHPTLGGHELRQTGDLGDDLLVGGQCARARCVAHI
jgi:hypothetical protein